MSAKRRLLLAGGLLAGLLVLSACGSAAQGSGAATASPAPTASADDTGAFVSAVQELYGPTGEGPSVKAGRDLSQCPVNARLSAALSAWPAGSDALCRCQNPWQSSAIAVATAGSIHVARVDLYFGATTYVKLDVYMARVSGRWLATDIRCRGGDDSTSVFAAAPPTGSVHSG